MSLFENSRYLKTKLYYRNGWDNMLFQIRERHKFNKDRCISYEWLEGDTLDGVSLRYYGLSTLRWAILDANPQYKTEFDINNGDIILLPHIDEVAEAVNVR